MALLASKLCPTAPTPRCVPALQPRPAQRTGPVAPAQSRAGFPDDARQSTPAPTPRRNDDTGRQAQSRGSVAAQSQAGGQGGPTRTEMADMFKRMNSVRAAEGKPAYKTFSLNTVVDFLTGRTMPDGTVWEQRSNDKQQLLADCAAVLDGIPGGLGATRASSPGEPYKRTILTRAQSLWLLKAVNKRIDPATQAVTPGGWYAVQDEFNNHFGLNKTVISLQRTYFRIRDSGKKQKFSDAELEAIQSGVNSLLASEGKPPLQQLSFEAMKAFLTGRTMPDGTMWKEGYKDRPALLADCAALMGIELSYDDMESDTEDTDRSETAVDYEGDSGSESGADSGEYVPGRKDGIATEAVRKARLEWLDNEVRQRMDLTTGRLALGSWDAITRAFNTHFQTNKTVNALQTFYKENETMLGGTPRQVLTALTPEQRQWLLAEAAKYTDQATGNVRVGTWDQITADFCERFNASRTTMGLRRTYYTLQTRQRSEKRNFSESEIAALITRVNSVRAREGKGPVKVLTLPTMTEFLQGRVMPDGTRWAQGHKDKQDLLVDCAAVVGLKPSDTAATGQRTPARATSSPSTRDMGGSHVDEDIDDEPVNMASYTSPQEYKLAQLEWLTPLVLKRTDKTNGRVIPGSWPVLTAAFNRRYNDKKSPDTLKKWYNDNQRTRRAPSVERGSLTPEQLDWLREAAESRMGPGGDMPRGGWQEVYEGFTSTFGVQKSAKALKEMYYQKFRRV